MFKNKAFKVKKHKVSISYDDSFGILGPSKGIIYSLNETLTFLKEFKIKPINFKIYLIYSREQYDKKVKRSSERWEIANTSGSSFIILHPDVIENETSHKKEEFEQILTHEFTHVITNSINPNFLSWISEGVALNIAGQNHFSKYVNKSNADYFIKNSLYTNVDNQDFVTHEGYEISYWLVRYILEKYGKEKFLSLIKVENDISSKDKLKEIFGKSNVNIEREILTSALKLKEN